MKKEQIIILSVLVVVIVAIIVYAKLSPKENVVQDDMAANTTTSEDMNSSEMEASNTETPATQDETPATNNKTMKYDNGLEVTTLVEGSGDAIKAGNTAVVNYTGVLNDGTTFDSNVDPKFGHVEPFSFVLGQGMVIAGWEQGVLGMKVGEKRKLVIPATLGYGAQGAGNAIPPNATLTFTVELVAIK